MVVMRRSFNSMIYNWSSINRSFQIRPAIISMIYMINPLISIISIRLYFAPILTKWTSSIRVVIMRTPTISRTNIRLSLTLRFISRSFLISVISLGSFVSSIVTISSSSIIQSPIVLLIIRPSILRNIFFRSSNIL